MNHVTLWVPFCDRPWWMLAHNTRNLKSVVKSLFLGSRHAVEKSFRIFGWIWAIDFGSIFLTKIEILPPIMRRTSYTLNQRRRIAERDKLFKQTLLSGSVILFPLDVGVVLIDCLCEFLFVLWVGILCAHMCTYNVYHVRVQMTQSHWTDGLRFTADRKFKEIECIALRYELFCMGL